MDDIRKKKNNYELMIFLIFAILMIGSIISGIFVSNKFVAIIFVSILFLVYGIQYILGAVFQWNYLFVKCIKKNNGRIMYKTKLTESEIKKLKYQNYSIGIMYIVFAIISMFLYGVLY